MYTKFEIKCLFLIIVVFIAACVETDIYLPAFPDMMAWFQTTEGAIQSLLTWNFVGICLAGPIYGPISDSFGRKKPLMVALALFLLGSIVTVFAQSLDQMLWGRVLQGVGSGGCFTLGTAIIFDAFQKERAIAATTSLNTIIPLIMAAAPLFGGFLNNHFGFRSNFLVIALFVLLSLVVCLFFLKETHPVEKRTPLEVKKLLRDFKEVFCHLGFWQLTLVMSVIFGGYISFLSGTSVLYVVEFGMAKVIFPFVQAAILAGWVAGSLTINRVVAKWGAQQVKKIGIISCVVGGFAFALIAIAFPENPYMQTAAMMLYSFGANWMIGLYFPEGMELLPHIKGLAASLLTSARLFLTALIVGLASSLYNGTIYPLAAVVAGTVIVILPTLIYYEKARSAKASTV